MVTHLTGAEQFWIGEVVGRKSANPNREAAFHNNPKNKDELIQLLDQRIQNIQGIINNDQTVC